MELYVIQRADGRFVLPPGCERSYTDLLQEAWVFRSKADARRNCCQDNERVVWLLDCLRGDRDG